MNDQTPDELDHTLTESLQTRWPARALPERQVQTILTHIETQNRKIPMQTRLSNILRPVAFVGGLALLVLALSWLFSSMRPNPAGEITPTPTAFNTAEANPLPAESTDPNATFTPTPAGDITPTSTPFPTVAIPANGFHSMPNVIFSFASSLPTSPSQITLYQQQPQGELNEETARAMAAQMGVNGEISSYPGEGGDTVYEVTNGDIRMIFYGFPDQFSYFPSTPDAPGDPLPFDERVALATDFLNAHGLLDYAYRAEPSETDPNGVRFVELLDGIPLVYGIGKNPGLIERINISVNPAGQISSLFHSHHHYQPLASYPLLTAEQAWVRLSQPDAETRARYAVLAAPMAWTRAGTEPTETLTGYLSNENGDTTFYTDDGRSFTLLDIPADMPLYPSLEIRGTIIDNTLDWSAMTLMDYGYGTALSCGGGGGGGGSSIPDANFGGGNFAMVMLDPLALPTPTQMDNPLQPGDAVEGVQGNLYIVRHISVDGTESYRYNFWNMGDETNPGWYATLEGDALNGTENLQNLPIHIWGTVTSVDENGQPIIDIDRYEEAYPDLRIQAWWITQQVVTIEGQEVVLLTTQDGLQFVSNQSITWGPEGSLAGNAGDAVIIEGYLIPDQTFGGYPVINELMTSIASGTSPDTYSIQSTLIGIQDDSAFSNPAPTLTGHVTIEQIELMYAAATLTQCSLEFVNNPDYTPWLYAHPVWRFTGTFDDGRTFEVQIQALPDEYLR